MEFPKTSTLQLPSYRIAQELMEPIYSSVLWILQIAKTIMLCIHLDTCHTTNNKCITSNNNKCSTHPSRASWATSSSHSKAKMAIFLITSLCTICKTLVIPKIEIMVIDLWKFNYCHIKPIYIITIVYW